MGALSPLFLLAGAAIAVPIYLHLFQRHETRRVSFPALRYLERTEREHARRIRLRQILLMLTRVAVLLLIVGAGARLFFGGRGASHPPTAVVMIVDNSMSSGLVVGEVRVLDELKQLAYRALDASNAEDRFWVIRAGEPWIPAIPGTAEEARAAVEATGVSDAAGDLTAAIRRAARLLETSTLTAREIHVLSDLQATAFQAEVSSPAGDFPVVVWAGDDRDPLNRALTGVVVGGGLPPLEGQRTEVTVSALESVSDRDTSHVPVRLVVNERIRGAATLPPGAQTSLALPPSGSGWVQGYADADPDALRADDRRFFAYRSRPAPSVATAGDPGIFVTEALAVLEGAGRLRPSAPAAASVLLSADGLGLQQASATAALFVMPPTDPTMLPALNRALAAQGIPWRLEPSGASGETELSGPALPGSLEQVRVRARFTLRLAADPPGPVRILAEADGEPWAVEGADAEGRRYLIIGSPLDARGTSLPVSTGMLQFVDWVTSEWSGTEAGAPGREAGAHLPAPAAASHVRFPGGTVHEIDGTRTVRGTGEAGVYAFLAQDSVVSLVALNPPTGESRLARVDLDRLANRIGEETTTVDREGAWEGAVFRSRQGPELWWPFLLAVVALLALEAVMASSGERDRGAARSSPTGRGADAVV
jgi:hypothetical protein